MMPSRPSPVQRNAGPRCINGIGLIKRIRDRTNSVRILVWSTHSESLYAERALRAGARGYITKETDKLIEAIRRLLAGKFYLSDTMAEKMLHRAVGDGWKNPRASRSTHGPIANYRSSA
jgi:DNA-binding NarL/FixJ family response regulator